MDFLTLLWGLVAFALVFVLIGTGLVISFWLRCDFLQEQKDCLQRLLEVERSDRARLADNLMELQAALSAERFHVDQLQRKVDLLRLPVDRE
jgi:signal transduction histidine kinase